MKGGFRTNLRDELDYHDLTVKELSKKTGISKKTLDSYLGARASMPPADIAVKIASALGVTVEYLINGQELKKQNKLYNNNIRSIIDTLIECGEKEIEMIMEITKIIKKQQEKKTKR